MLDLFHHIWWYNFLIFHYPPATSHSELENKHVQFESVNHLQSWPLFRSYVELREDRCWIEFHSYWMPRTCVPRMKGSNTTYLSFLWQISFAECDMFEGLFSDNLSDNLSDDLSDNHLLHSVPWPSLRAMSITLESTWKDMQNEYERNMNGT